jgi:hypothetical protein
MQGEPPVSEKPKIHKLILKTILSSTFMLAFSLSLSLADTFYRAPDNVLTLSIPDIFEPAVYEKRPAINSEEPDLLSHQIFRNGSIDKSVTFHIKVTACKVPYSLNGYREEYLKNLDELADYLPVSSGKDEFNKIRSETFLYSFTPSATKDGASSIEFQSLPSVYRYDSLSVSGNYKILLCLEGSKKGVFFNIGTFKEILKSMSLPRQDTSNVSSLSTRIAQFKDRHKTDLTYNTGKPSLEPAVMNDQPSSAYEGPSSESQGTVEKTEATFEKTYINGEKVPPPPVIADGNPPLTIRTVAAWKTVLEWTVRTRLTALQEKDLKETLKKHYEAGGKAKDTVLSFTNTLSPFHLYSLEPSRAADLRDKLIKKFEEMSREKDLTSDGWNLFERIFYSQHAVLEKGDVPMTVQIRDGALEMLFFIETLLKNNSPRILSEQGMMDKVKFSSNLRHRWGSFAKIEQEALSDILFQWSEIRLLWTITNLEIRDKIAIKLRDGVQKICSLSGLNKAGNNAELSAMYLKATIANPPTLAVLATSISSHLKEIMSRPK